MFKQKVLKTALLTSLLAPTAFNCQAKEGGKKRDVVAARFPTPITVPAATQARLEQWYADAKFGAFIHFGAYSPLAGSYQGKGEKHKYAEWIQMSAKIPASEYHQIAAKFNPSEFNAEQWVKTFKAAGMKYVVITAKHHDGFALFKSKASDYNIVDKSVFKRDIIKELSDSCQRHGLKFGVYYSHAQDWDEPNAPMLKAHDSINIAHPNLPASFKPDMQRYLEEKAYPQVEELVKNYPIDLIWFDTPVGISYQQAERFKNIVRKYQPDALINSRIILNAKGVVEQKHYQLFDYISVGDKRVPKKPIPYYFESPDSITTSYGYKLHGKVRYHSAKELIQRMVHTVAANGNYLLNNGPMGNGKLDPKAVALYQEMGQWLAVNGESVWQTRANPFAKRPKWGDITTNKQADTLYLHIMKWPQSGSVSLKGLSQLNDVKAKVISAAYLASNDKVSFEQQGSNITIKLSEQALDKYDTVIKVLLDKPLLM